MRVCISTVSVIGPIWWPSGAVCSLDMNLTSWDIEQIRDYGNGTIDREAVEQWLCLHSGDFQHVQDFHADISDGDADYLFDWSDPDSEWIYADTLGGMED